MGRKVKPAAVSGGNGQSSPARGRRNDSESTPFYPRWRQNATFNGFEPHFFYGLEVQNAR